MEYLGPLTLRFFKVMLATIVVVVLAGLARLAATGGPPPIVISVIPVMVAGFSVGREHMRIVGKGPGFRNGLIMALVFYLVNLVTSVVIMAGAFAYAGAPAGLGDVLPALGLPFLMFTALWIIMIRVMMWFGGRAGF